MGTLGCINDMLRRDKENRELRQRNRDRMKDTYRKLLDVGNKTQLPSSSIEEWEDNPSLMHIEMVSSLCYQEN